MEILKQVLHYLWGPLVGAVIGYLTNYIAVKMMFRPYKKWSIGRFTVPFTPGIIPKRKNALAKAIGGAVSNYLFTSEDLHTLLLDEKTEERMVDMVMRALDIPLDFDGGADGVLDTKTATELGIELFSEEQFENSKEMLTDFFTRRALAAVSEMDLGTMIAQQGASVILEKKASLGIAALFLNEGTVQSFLPSIAEKINEYIDENGEQMVRSAVVSQIEYYANRPMHNLLKHIGEAQIRAVITAAYKKLVTGMGSGFAEALDIQATVEAKVAQMTPRELEVLVLTIMKRELSAIVNLGAIIGFILGLFNLIGM